MPLIGYPIGDIDEHIIIDDAYKPQDFQSGWYFLPYNFPSYTFVSTDFDNKIEEVVKDGDKYYVQGFDPYIEKMDFPNGGIPIKKEYVKENYLHYPSGVPFEYNIGYYWELFGDLNSPYLFVPYFDSNTYGEIVWLDFNAPLERFQATLPFVEHLLTGVIFPFVEKLVTDKTYVFPIKEKIISLLNCDIEMVSPDRVKITWTGEKVPMIEILRKELSDSKYGEPIATVDFNDGYYELPIDNNSYTYSVRGTKGTGTSNVEVTIGVKGTTDITAIINLGDFVKIYESDIGFKEVFETEILI